MSTDERQYGRLSLFSGSVPSLRHAKTDQNALASASAVLNELGYQLQDAGVHHDLSLFRGHPASEISLVDVRLRPPNDPQQDRAFPNYLEQSSLKIVWFCDEAGLDSIAGLDGESARGEFFIVPPYVRSQVEHCLESAKSFFQQSRDSIVNSLITSDSILSYLNDGILVADNDGIVNYANKRLCSITGLPFTRVMYAPIDDVLQIVEVETIVSNGIGQNGTVSSGNEWCKIVQNNGTRVPVEKWEIPFSRSGVRIGTIIGLRDNTVEQEYIRRIEKAKSQAEQASHAKNEFLANISHELRTPLNSILGMAELALDMSRNREQEEYLRILRISADSLYDLITSMLDYVKLESGTFNIRERAFHLSDTIDTIAATFAINCHMKHLGFHIITQVRDGFSYIGDETRITQIINNLLSNALKFTESGEIVLSFRELSPGDYELSDRFRDSSPLEISVRDTGIGIQPERLWDIFQPFLQIESSSQHYAGGTGIGLTITKMLVEAMGGKIRAASTPGKGSEFICTVWLKQGGQRRIVDGHRLASNMIVCFLVSESHAWIAAIQPWLEHMKIQTCVCTTVEEFEQRVRENSDRQIHCFFHGVFSRAADLLALCLKPEMSVLLHNRHVLTLRIPREEEQHWQAAPFAYAILFEPIRSSTLVSLINELELEHFGESWTSEPEHYHSVHHLKILFAEEDNPERSRTLGALGAAGHTVTVVPHGKSLLAQLENESFDLLIVDINMPLLNGYEAISTIRAGGIGFEKKSIPIIALPPRGVRADEKPTEILGLSALLPKPFSIPSLLRLIDRVWERTLGGDGFISQTPGMSEMQNLIARLRVSIKEEQWENAQNSAQDLRRKYKQVPMPDQAERCFRLILALRSHETGGAMELLNEILKQEEEQNESIDS